MKEAITVVTTRIRPCAVALVTMMFIGCKEPPSAPEPCLRPSTPPETRASAEVDTATQGTDQILSRMAQQFSGTMMRPFNGGAPVFPIPSNYSKYFRSHPSEAMVFLNQKLNSENAAAQVNALDFVTEIADIPSAHYWAMAVMRNAMNGGLGGRNTVESTYTRLLAADAATRPSAPGEERGP